MNVSRDTLYSGIALKGAECMNVHRFFREFSILKKWLRCHSGILSLKNSTSGSNIVHATREENMVKKNSMMTRKLCISEVFSHLKGREGECSSTG
jgi:hypothetical protein